MPRCKLRGSLLPTFSSLVTTIILSFQTSYHSVLSAQRGLDALNMAELSQTMIASRQQRLNSGQAGEHFPPDLANNLPSFASGPVADTADVPRGRSSSQSRSNTLGGPTREPQPSCGSVAWVRSTPCRPRSCQENLSHLPDTRSP